MRKNILALLGVIFLPLLAFAQSTMDADSLWRTIDLDDVVVTAQYAPTAVENAIHPVKIIKIEEIERQGQINLAEVLTNQLNLRVSTDPILGNGLQIQGLGGQNVQIMIDGVPVIGRLGGNIDLSQINLHNVQRIEIIEGAMSAQYGSNASGGVVNIITKKSQLKKFQVHSQNQYESIGIYNNALGVSAQLDQLYISLMGARNESQFIDVDSLRLFEEAVSPSGVVFQTKTNPWNPKTQYNADGTLRYRFSDSTNLTYQFRYFNEVLSNYGGVRRPQFRPYAFDEFYTTKRLDHSLNLETYIGKNFYLNSTTAYNQYDREKETERLDMETDTTSFTSFLHRSILSTVSDSKLNAQVGFEILGETGSGGRIVDSTSTPYDEAAISNYAMWASLRYNFTDKLTMQANLRYGYNTKYDHPLIPSFNLDWRPTKDWSLQLSYAHGFRSPTLKELHFRFIDTNHYIIGNPDLKAEDSKNLSLSAKRELPLDRENLLVFSGKLFYNQIRNRIIIAEFAPLQFNYQNLDQFETHGLNAQFEYEYKDEVRLKSGFAFTRLYNDWSEDYEDADKFTGLHEWQNELSIKVPFVGSRITLVHRFIGRQVRFYLDEMDTLQEGFVGKYHLVNASLSQSFWEDRIFLSLGTKNLLDTQTIPFNGSSGSAHGNVGSRQLLNWGRTYFIRLNLTL
ncbi:MAG: TonB-dependent receptor [Bacteroidota bacterium]